ncbi:unnamed protein product [Schistosoma bovis]|nr:unnamed protein product [Schistosoma bovis]CAH8674574.1 unnamed protein product [Schistosoma bovis]
MKQNNYFNYHVHLLYFIVILFNNNTNVQSAWFYSRFINMEKTTPDPFDTPENRGKIQKIYYLKSDNNICFIMKAEIKLVIPLKGSKENITSHLDSTTKNIEFSGFCDSTLTHLSVKWINLSQKSPWLLTFIFKLYANDYYTFDSTNFNYVLNDEEIYSSSSDQVFSVQKDQYYNCTKAIKIELHPSDRNYSTVRLIFKSLEVEAFRESPGTSYVGKESHCSSDDNESLTYIIVSISIFTMAVVMIFVLCLSNDETQVVGVDHYR